MPLTGFFSAVVVQSWMAAVQGATLGGAGWLSAGFAGFAGRAAAIAVTAIWQGALIASGLAICLRIAPRTSAENRFSIWTAAFGVLVSLPFFTLIADLRAAVVAGVPAAGVEAATQRPWLSIDARWSVVIAGFWAAATLIRAGDLVFHSLRLRKLWKDAIPVELDGNLGSLVAQTRARWSRGTIEVCTTTTLQRPSVIGFLKPRILIPEWLFARLTAGELEQIVLHECEHLRRHDDWTNLFQKLCLVLFPLNPALAWMERRLCREREMACDDGVIRITHAPRAYAACLASLAERGLERRAEALSLGAWQRRPELVDRVHSILRRRRTLGPMGTGALLGGLGFSLLFGSIELARCPQLIAFVPAQDHIRNLQTANVDVRARTRFASAKPLNAAYVPVESRGLSRASSEFRTTRIEAVLPANGPEQPSDARPSVLGGRVNREAAPGNETAAGKSDTKSPREVTLKAELPGSQPVAAPEQQWIVLTEWEQVQTTNQSAGLTADYGTGRSASVSGDSVDKDAQSNTHPVSQIMVTRLILRIYPASSLTSQTAIAQTRNGWFVIQL